MNKYLLKLEAFSIEKTPTQIEYEVLIHQGDKASLTIVPDNLSNGRLVFETPNDGAISIHPNDWSTVILSKIEN